jgi:hypothetical protein
MEERSVHNVPLLLTKLCPLAARAPLEKLFNGYSIATGNLYPGVVSFTTTENRSPFSNRTAEENGIV